MTSTQAHTAYLEAMRAETSFARESELASDSASFDRAMAQRWRWLDVAARAVESHNPDDCVHCRGGK